MSRTYYNLALLIVLCCSVLEVSKRINTTLSTQKIRQIPVAPADSESQLAYGYKLNLGVVTLADLELVPGVSTQIAEELLAKRGQIITASEQYDLKDRYRALEVIKGIGPKTAKKLANYLEW
jgi:DNA uptake protein ComE-like DNA-binding protein